MRDKRLDDKAWRERVGFDNIAKPLWTTPEIFIYDSRKLRPTK